MNFEVKYYFDGNSRPLAGKSPEEWTRQGLEPLREQSGGACFSLQLYQAAPLMDASLITELAREMLRRGINALGLPVGVLRLLGAEQGAPKHRFDSLYCSAVTESTEAQLCAELYQRIAEAHAARGVRIISAGSVFIDSTVTLAKGVEIMPFCIICGNSAIGKNTVVGAQSEIRDSIIGENCRITASVICGASVGDCCEIGPFAYLRQGTRLGRGVRIGDFVETKHATLGDGVKAAHHAYIGDAVVGERTNIGCGTVFANYDGCKKHQTTVGKNVFIGCNTNLIAPLTVGDNAFIAGGSTITEDIPPECFAIARQRQTTKQSQKPKA